VREKQCNPNASPATNASIREVFDALKLRPNITLDHSGKEENRQNCPFHPRICSQCHRSGRTSKRLVNLATQSVYFPFYLRMGVLDILQYQPVDVGNPKLREIFLTRLENGEEKKKIYEGMTKNIQRAGADNINVIDLDNIRIKATVSNPHQYCEGIQYMIMNGKLVIEGGQWNGTLAGEVLKLKKTEN